MTERPAMAESPHLLEIEGLRVRFRTEGGEVTVVDDLAMTVRPHETLAVVGESGSGKSVTALALMRLPARRPRNARSRAASRSPAASCWACPRRRCAPCAATTSR